jgi:nucleoside-diphosphate-sugar epimerase
MLKTVYVTGGGGYVGSALVPKLLKAGYRVRVLDLFMFGEDMLGHAVNDPNLEVIKGDLRNTKLLKETIPGSDAVIHLACISNDPSFELDAELGKSINYDAFLPLVDISKDSGVKRFIYASSSSVYGIKNEPEVIEDMPLEPLTDYSKYKAMCEVFLNNSATNDFTVTTIRPSTVCGYSPRLRLDLIVNILTNHAINNGKITVFGGEQKRPNLHIEDMTDLYLFMLEQPGEKIQNKIYNVGCENYKVREIAEMVRDSLGGKIPIVIAPTDDNRSYHVSSKKIREELGFETRHTVQEAVQDLKKAFDGGNISDPMTNIHYYNIKTMQAIKLK